MKSSWVRFLAALAAASVSVSAMNPEVFAQDAAKPAADEAAKQESGEEKPEADPFAIPEGNAEDLMKFVQTLATMRPTARDAATAREFQTKRLDAVVKACTKIIELKPEEKVELFAIENRFGALSALVANLDPTRASELEALTAELEKDTRLPVRRLVAGTKLRGAMMAAMQGRDGSPLKDVAQMTLAYCEEFGADPSVMTITTNVGRALGAAGETDAAVELYERMSEYMAKAEDQRLRDRADTMLGAARFIKLPGNAIEVNGKLADGSDFKWEDYRGKVVLVDFWASWCGPCMGELPNMKKNLTKYGEKGFTIVGVNMDDDNARFEKCLTDKEITWVNLVGEGEGKSGWSHPLAKYYGISAIPAAILVDKDGKVISLRARGGELDRLLEEQFGPVEEPAETKE